MKTIYIFLALLAIGQIARCEHLIPSSLDPNLAEAREKACTPWCNPEESGAYWNKLRSSNIPIYHEHKVGNLERHIYIPNPGTGYWVLGGLTEKTLFKTHREKLKIDDTLISGSFYQDEKGNKIYWALWAPRERAYLITDEMRKFGIGQARIEFSLIDKIMMWAADLQPFSGFLMACLLVVNLTMLLLNVFIVYRLSQRNKNA